MQQTSVEADDVMEGLDAIEETVRE